MRSRILIQVLLILINLVLHCTALSKVAKGVPICSSEHVNKKVEGIGLLQVKQVARKASLMLYDAEEEDLIFDPGGL